MQILTQQVLDGACFFVFLKCSQVMLVCCFTLSKKLIPISHIPWLQMEASREIFKVTDTYSHTDNWMKVLMWGPGINIFKVTRWCENEVTIENSCLRWYLFLFNFIKTVVDKMYFVKSCVLLENGTTYQLQEIE